MKIITTNKLIKSREKELTLKKLKEKGILKLCENATREKRKK